MVVREKGRVKWFNNAKGYGFVLREEDNKDVFVHYRAIRMEGYRTLKTGQEVEYTLITGDKGLQAEEVIVLSEAPADMSEFGNQAHAGLGQPQAYAQQEEVID